MECLILASATSLATQPQHAWPLNDIRAECGFGFGFIHQMRMAAGQASLAGLEHRWLMLCFSQARRCCEALGDVLNHSSTLSTGVTKMPLAGPRVNGERTARGTCPGESLKSILHSRQTALEASA